MQAGGPLSMCHNKEGISRRRFLQTGSVLAGVTLTGNALWDRLAWCAQTSGSAMLSEFGYGDVTIASDLPEQQLINTIDVLMALSDDSLLKPLRQMSGQAAPGEDLGGWYHYNPNYDYRKEFDDGFAPACTFGQWVSALARSYAVTGDQAVRQRVMRLNQLYARTITADFYINNRFPAYCYDKLLLGLIDSHTYVKDPQALAILEQTTNTALPHLPGHAIEHGVPWRTEKDKNDVSWTWDESYTISENLLLASQRGAGERYYKLGLQYLDDKDWFDPLSRNEHVLNDRHAYSYVNSLCSAMMAYMVAGSEKHLRAARNAFAMLQNQSYATGGWGPDETLRAPESNDLYASLENTHHSFETPCGSYAHFKLTRYLLRVTRDSRYGDSMERVMYNTVLGAKPLQENGENFYYSDYNYNAKRVYKQFRWACCSGTLPQVATDYRINMYFRAPRAVYVNLYLPSTLRWMENDTALSLTQESNYPFEDHVTFTVTSSKPVDLTLNFRIPAWAEEATVSVNGIRQKELGTPGQFAAVHREWKSGDRIELNLPLTMRLEAIDKRHTDTVALLRGPLVLMAVKNEQESPVPRITRQQLLTAARISERQWQVDTVSGKVTMQPFISMGDLPYTTYVKLV
ncbi:beta-L-arabinofuranosidase domain-containing protein [Silvibacterium acidisoli]|uniref:beta-L-arabinofuranosidase domain-containing protein n=1 Tax=Acidobacteriaceae bacterium ZG23-2 TaxID=2883246 RepID=UPI00406D3FF2